MENLFYLVSEFVLGLVYSWSDLSFGIWILISADSIITLRQVIFGFLVCSIKCQKIGTGYKNAKAIRKQQGIFSRITFSYISEYLLEEYRKSYRTYMVLHTLYLIWLVLCTLWFISTTWIVCDNEVLIKGIIGAIGVVIWVLLLIPYNAVTHLPRRVERRFPASHH